MPAARFVRALLALPLALVLVLAASTLTPAADASAASKKASRHHKVAKATSVALRQIGDPYRYGARGPRAFDCSGLVQYSLGRAGIRVPRTSRAQARAAHRIPRSKLRRGDLIFFHDGGRVYHAAMFVKRQRGRVVMVHAPGRGKRVRRDSPWTNSWFAATVRR